MSPRGGTGLRSGLKIRGSKELVGSNPTGGIIIMKQNKLTNKGVTTVTLILTIVAVLVLGGGIWYWQNQKSNVFIFPSGGEKLIIGNNYNIRWSGTTLDNKDTYISLHLAKPCSGIFDKTCGPYNNNYGLLPDRTENDGLFSWAIPSEISSGKYYLAVDCVGNCSSISSGKSNIFDIVEGTSNANKTLLVDLKINNNTSLVPPIPYDSTFVVSWTSTGATYCIPLGYQIPIAGGGVWGDLNKKLPTSGSMILRASVLNTNAEKVYVPQLAITIRCYNEFDQSVFDNEPVDVIKP